MKPLTNAKLYVISAYFLKMECKGIIELRRKVSFEQKCKLWYLD